MTALHRNVKKTRFRMGLNDWFRALGWCLLVGCGAWCVLVVVVKLWAWTWPLGTIGLGLLGLVLVVSLVWAKWSARDDLAAAALLDEAAGLKERTSSALCCLDSEDPFAQAVAQDAEDISQRISVRSFVRLKWPASLSFAAVALLAALIVTGLPINPLQADPPPTRDSQDSAEARKVAVRESKRRLQNLKEQLERNPALATLKQPLKTIDQLPEEKLKTPQSIRREEIKKIDHFADAVREQFKQKEDRMQAVKRMLRGLKVTRSSKTPTQKLSQALARGDFKAASNAMRELQEELAKLREKNDPEKQKELQKRLSELAKRLQEAADQAQRKEQLQKALEQAGVDPETAKRALEHLTKRDLEQIKEQMKKKGASEEEAKEMAKKCRSCQAAGSQGSNLAESMQKAAQAMQGESNMKGAAQQLSEAADMLNAMEQLDQQLGEMQSTLEDLQEAKNDLSSSGNNPGDQDCRSCGGKGCQQCGGTGKQQGRGGGMGKMGQGRGGIPPEQSTAVKFKKVRSPVITTKGAIISKMFVDGQQVRGEVATEAAELFAAAERDATDTINKNKIPNQYREAIKEYFSQVREEFEDSQSAASP